MVAEVIDLRARLPAEPHAGGVTGGLEQRQAVALVGARGHAQPADLRRQGVGEIVAVQVGGGDQDPFKILHFLQKDVLHGIEGLRCTIILQSSPFTKYTIGLIEKQDRRPLSTG